MNWEKLIVTLLASVAAVLILYFWIVPVIPATWSFLGVNVKQTFQLLTIPVGILTGTWELYKVVNEKKVRQ